MKETITDYSFVFQQDQHFSVLGKRTPPNRLKQRGLGEKFIRQDNELFFVFQSKMQFIVLEQINQETRSSHPIDQ